MLENVGVYKINDVPTRFLWLKSDRMLASLLSLLMSNGRGRLVLLSSLSCTVLPSRPIWAPSQSKIFPCANKASGSSYHNIVTLPGFPYEDWNVRPHFERLFDFIVLSETETSHPQRTSTATGPASPPCLKIIDLTRLSSEKNDVAFFDVVDLLRAIWPCRLRLPDEVGYLYSINIYSWTGARISGVTENSFFSDMTQHQQVVKISEVWEIITEVGEGERSFECHNL